MSLRQEQWMEVGRAFEQIKFGRTARQGAIANWVGLCHAIGDVVGHGEHYSHLRYLLGRDGFWLDKTRPNDLLRASFAYLMAAMTDAERDQIVEGL